MIFNSVEFILFFFVLLGVLSLLRRNRDRKVLLLVASWYFYAYWDWRFLSLIWFSTGVDFCVAKRLQQESSERARKVLLSISLGANLGLLCFFKYFNFFIDSMRPVLEGVGFHTGTLDILLPVGISFYTFQTLSYTIDVYRRAISAHDSILDFALFVGFFPQLVAGPIVRASRFLPQLETMKPLTKANAYVGFQLFVYGLFKKVVVADRLAVFPDYVFLNAGLYDSATTWLAVASYTLQIYYDFSGYSDMAIGLARVLGYDLGENFNFPYLSRSPREFWRRWHISLSDWIRDYLYIPLGGSWHGHVRTVANVMISMLLCGLWHGASWSFVAWGGYHGLGQIGNRVFAQLENDAPHLRMLCWLGTLLFVMVGWVMFRAGTFQLCGLMYRQMFFPEAGVTWMYPFAFAAITGTALIHFIKCKGLYETFFLPAEPRWYSPALLLSLLGIAMVFYPEGFQPFIYFQF